MNPPHIAVRNTARLALWVLAAMLVVAIVFESGQAPIAVAIQAHAPRIVLTALPLLYVAFVLRRGSSRSALALGVAYPLVIVLSVGHGLWTKFHSGTEGAMDVMFSFLFFWVSAPWTLFLFACVPLLLRLLVVSSRAYRTAHAWQLVPVVAWGAVLLFAINAARSPLRSIAAETPEYHISEATNALETLNECIWRAAGPGAEGGFPDSLIDTRSVRPREYPRSANPPHYVCAEQLQRIPTYPFHVEYTTAGPDASGRAKRFTLTLTEKTRVGGRPKVVWIDEQGLRREAVVASGGQRDSVRLMGGSSLTNFLVVQHYLEAYAAKHGGEYPVRMTSDYLYRDGAEPPPGVLAADVAECSDVKHEVISCLERWERSMIYWPQRDASGRVSTYTLTVRPMTYYDYEHKQPIPSRTHHRDAQGAIHSFGGYRAAEETDPPPPADELAYARTSLASFLESEARRARRP
jgi:hypothetical protein